MRLGRTTLFYFLSQVVVSAAGFVSKFVIAVLLGEAVLGQYAVAVGLGGYWLAIPAAAIGLSVNKRISESTDTASYFTAGMIINILFGVTAGGAVLIVAYIIQTTGVFADTAFGSVLTASSGLIAGLVLMTVLYRTVISALQGSQRVALTGGLDAAERLVRTLLQVGVILIGFGLAGLLLGHIVALVIVVAVGIALLGDRFERPVKRHFENLFNFGKYASLSVLQGETYGWMDVIILSFFVSEGLVGIYEAAWGLAALLGVVSNSIRNTLFPEISKLASDNEYDRIRHVLGEGVVFSGIFVIPGLFGAVVMGPRLLAIYRPSFSKGATILVVLILAYVAEVYGKQFASALNAVDRPDLTYKLNLVFITSNILLNLLLIWQFGWIGAAVATFVSTALRAILAFVMLSQEVGEPDIPLRDVGYQIIAAAGMGGLLLSVVPVVPDTRLWTAAVVLFGAAVYLSILLVLSRLIRQKAAGLVQSIWKSDSVGL